MHRFCYALFMGLVFLATLALPALAQVDPDSIKPKNNDGPHIVYVGAYINDIHNVDLKTHSYLGDIYIWFRWTEADYRPTESFEFMNLFDPEASVEDYWYNTPKELPDGSYYNVVRHQGGFSSKMPLDKYPFDSQELTIIIEDSEYSSVDVVFRADDQSPPISRSEDIKIPGFVMSSPQIRLRNKTYPTNFGDLTVADNEAYSRVTFVLPLKRLKRTGIIKSLIPILIILLCAGLSLLVHPKYTEGRIGLVITALLTLVALQITASGDLPEVGYLMLIDKLHLMSYAFILVVLIEVVENTWHKDREDGDYSRAIKRDKIVLAISIVTMLSISTIIITQGMLE